MSIREKGYHHWQGELINAKYHWLPIFFYGIKSIINKKYSKFFISTCLTPFLVFLLALYVYTKPELQMLSMIVNLIKNDAQFFNMFFTNPISLNFLGFYCVLFFSDLISNDLKFNALPLFFSRPLDRKDYLLGKFSIIMFYFIGLTFIPGILLILFKIIFTGKVLLDLQVIMAIGIVPIIFALFIASLTLMASTLSKNSRYVKILLFSIFFVSNGLGEGMSQQFHNPYFNLFSLMGNLHQASSYLFGAPLKFNYPGYLSVLVLLGLIALFIFIINSKIKKAEAWIDAGN
jgi:ABC-2 type transport system permease protein